MSQKRISSAAINALKEALTHSYWYKRDLKNFLHNSISDPSILAKLNWDNNKRDIVSYLVDYLILNQKHYRDDLLNLMFEVTQITDFSHLEKIVDGGAKKAKDAKGSIEALKKIYYTYSHNEDEKRKSEERKILAQKKLEQTKATNEIIEQLKNDYFTLLSQSNNPQSRGYKLERFLVTLFELFDLDPRSAFKLSGEQIDGAFLLNNTDFIVEAKWHKDPISIQDLDSFKAKVSRKLENTLGLFISINGFSKEAITTHSSGQKVIILMDGMDIMAILEKRIDLVELLLLKKKAAAQSGNIFLRVDSILLA